MTLGALAVRVLQEHGVVSMFVSSDGKIELCPPGEIELDVLDEQEAISKLTERGYGESQMVSYLKGRDARAAARQKLKANDRG